MIRAAGALWLVSGLAQAATNSTSHFAPGFVEERANPLGSNSSYLGWKNSAKAREAKTLKEDELIQSAMATYDKFVDRVRVPGFISAEPIPPLARIVGPKTGYGSYRAGDVIYLRWVGEPLPKVGDRFATYSPAIVLQNTREPTDFEVVHRPEGKWKAPRDRRLAGYFYEAASRINVRKVENGLVQAVVDQMSSVATAGDEVMAVPPLLEKVTPVSSGIQLSAAVICGSPYDRLSTTERSFIYLNRGTRDGIKVGQVFESIDSVKLEESVGGATPEMSRGEAIVVHATDSFATAMIVHQFDVIRMGSLLRTRLNNDFVVRKQVYGGLFPTTHDPDALPDDAVGIPTQNLKGVPTVPNLENLPGSKDETLPELGRKEAPAPLSELDQMEGKLQLKDLTPAEKARLDKLSQQEKLNAAKRDEEDEEAAGQPGAPSSDNSFKQSKKQAQKGRPAKKKANDEEELNLMMMQN